jgi:GNAT superfamily N-acetyltransferase
MNSHIRIARVSDALEIARLSTTLGYPIDTTEISHRLEALLPLPSHLVLVKESIDGKSLVGWLAAERRVSLESGIRFEIVGLVVDEASRRPGVGKSLIGAFEQWVVVQGGGALVVRSNILRAESHGFYKSLGYTQKKGQHVYTKILSA